MHPTKKAAHERAAQKKHYQEKNTMLAEKRQAQLLETVKALKCAQEQLQLLADCGIEVLQANMSSYEKKITCLVFDETFCLIPGKRCLTALDDSMHYRLAVNVEGVELYILKDKVWQMPSLGGGAV